MSPAARRPSFRATAPLFAALGDETRLGLLSRLSAEGPLSIARLAAEVPITRQAVTKHLAMLAGAGLVRDVRAGRERRWELDPARLDEARRSLDAISAQWDQALSRLRSTVEE
jgi:DNA-binding transcriptional ArsR family regulator